MRGVSRTRFSSWSTARSVQPTATRTPRQGTLAVRVVHLANHGTFPRRKRQPRTRRRAQLCPRWRFHVDAGLLTRRERELAGGRHEVERVEKGVGEDDGIAAGLECVEAEIAALIGGGAEEHRRLRLETNGHHQRAAQLPRVHVVDDLALDSGTARRLLRAEQAAREERRRDAAADER